MPTTKSIDHGAVALRDLDQASELLKFNATYVLLGSPRSGILAAGIIEYCVTGIELRAHEI